MFDNTGLHAVRQIQMHCLLAIKADSGVNRSFHQLCALSPAVCARAEFGARRCMDLPNPGRRFQPLLQRAAGLGPGQRCSAALVGRHRFQCPLLQDVHGKRRLVSKCKKDPLQSKCMCFVEDISKQGTEHT